MNAPLIDPFARAIEYLRVSVTDRCDFRCVYCMSENMTFLPKKDLLTLEELDRMCSAFVRLGVRKLRIGKAIEPVQSLYEDFADGVLRNIEVTVPYVGTWVAPMIVQNLQFEGPYEGAVTFTLTLESAGAPDFTPEAP